MLKWWKLLLNQYPEFRWGRILDPACRRGATLSYLFTEHKCGNLWGLDKSKSKQWSNEPLSKIPKEHFIQADYLTYNFKDLKFDTILVNPPLEETKSYINKSLNLLNDGGTLVVLQTMGWLINDKVREWYKTLPLQKVILVPKHLNNNEEIFIYVFKKGFNGGTTVKWLGCMPDEFLLHPRKEQKKRFYFKLNRAK